MAVYKNCWLWYNFIHDHNGNTDRDLRHLLRKYDESHKTSFDFANFSIDASI